MTENIWKLSDYAVGKSYDERTDDREQERKVELAKIKSNDFADFDEGAAMAVPRHDDFEAARIEDDGFGLPVDVSDIDLSSPPGFVGKVTDWIDGQCRYPRRRLCVASAITAVGNIGGMSHYDVHDGVTANMLSFCVAASSTGKEAVMQAFTDLHVAAGVQKAMQGGIKSEQELVRNLIEHQAAFYNVDEIGIFLTKVKNAQTRGGASYLEGVFGVIMSAYSKANSRFLLSGDVKRDLRKIYAGALAKAEDDDDADRIDRASRMLSMIDNGLERPFLSLMGFTTPSTFEGLMDGDSASQGFVGRSIIVAEREINPRPRKGFSKVEMPIMMAGKLGLIYGGDEVSGRIEHAGARRDVFTDPDAADILEKISDWLIDYADHMGEKTGQASVALIRRAYELIAKVSFVLAIPDGTRTVDHVRWAFAYVKDELDFKVQLVFANDNAKQRPEDALAARMLNHIDAETGKTEAMLANFLHLSEPEVVTILRNLEARGEVVSKLGRKYRGKQAVKWFRVK